MTQSSAPSSSSPSPPVLRTSDPSDPSKPFKNIIFVGGSYVTLAAILHFRDHPLPSNHRIVVIEPHSHAHYMFGFPRAAVVPGFERDLFVPYHGLFSSPDMGEVVQARVVGISETSVVLDRVVEGFDVETGREIPYAYLVYCTGALHPSPGNLNACESKESGVLALKGYQKRIAEATRVLIVGAGAVGLELASEIKERYPEKEVTLVHSRERYMTGYKMGLHHRAYGILKKLGVRQILGDRVIVPDGGFVDDGRMIACTTKKGVEIQSDLQIPCTGMTPNSSVLSTLSPSSVDPTTRLVRILPTLQIADTRFPNVFAGGDVVDSPDIKTGLSAFCHARVIAQNLNKLTRGETTGLEERTLVKPQIFLYFGKTQGIGQLAMFGWLFTVGTWLCKYQFSDNVGAGRLWNWAGTPLTEETADF
ncbi:hypothetical protein HKX48_000383 [Thoreauomyces humboldtii]|nr:hypothetical protein HKX48_000383 [Thoreauomyces humboldtii]